MGAHMRAIGAAVLALLLIVPAAPASSQFPGAEQAKIDWRQFAGQTITVIHQKSFLMDKVFEMTPDFEKLTGITMNRIPFRGGPQVVQELVAGRVHFYVSPTLAIASQYQAQQLKILAVSAPERLKNLSEIPTLKEKGVDFVRFGWLGVCAGAGTPQPILDRLNRQIAAIVATADYRAIIEKAGSIAVSSTPDELQQVITQTLDDVGASIREFGLQQEQ